VAGIAIGLVATAAVGSEPACPDGAPLESSVQLDYAVTASRSVLSLKGDGSVVFRRSDDAYTMESTVQAFGIFEAHQSSVGAVAAGGLVPRTFTQRTSRRPPLSVTFDWSAKRVSFSDNGNSAPTRPQMQDRLSMIMQLAWRHRKDPGAGEIKLPIAGLRGDSDYVFTGGERQTVTVPAGRFDAIRFERSRSDGDNTLEVWLAPALCALPVRLRFSNDNGVVIDQQLRALKPL
jgi:hypothetical protein